MHSGFDSEILNLNWLWLSSLFTLHNEEIKIRRPNGSLLLCIHLCCVPTKPRYSSVHFSLIMLKFSSHLNFFYGSVNKSTDCRKNITEGDFIWWFLNIFLGFCVCVCVWLFCLWWIWSGLIWISLGYFWDRVPLYIALAVLELCS